MRCISCLFVLCLLAISFDGLSKEVTHKNLTGPYLGQTPPGSAPTVFAPDIVSTNGWEVSGVFTPDLSAFYYIRNNEQSNKQEIVEFKNKHGGLARKYIFPSSWHTVIFSKW